MEGWTWWQVFLYYYVCSIYFLYVANMNYKYFSLRGGAIEALFLIEALGLLLECFLGLSPRSP
jgi:hypothetical protein